MPPAAAIPKLEVFCHALCEADLSEPLDYAEIFRILDREVVRRNPNVTKQALANAHGDWYEWLLSIAAWNAYCSGYSDGLAVQLPNRAQFDCSELYVQDLFRMIEHLRSEVERSSDVSLITSNPDFVILGARIVGSTLQRTSLIQAVKIQDIERLTSLYQDFRAHCQFEDITGYLAAKYSLRPDRLLQVPHEGSLMKALYAHLQTRLWITNPRGLKYFLAAGAITQANREALATVATHSITIVSSKPEAAVDRVFVCGTSSESHDMFVEIQET